MSKQTKIFLVIALVVIIGVVAYFFIRKSDESVTTKTSTGLAGSGGVSSLLTLFI